MTSSARMLKFIEFKGINKTNFYKQVGLSNGYLDKVSELGSDKIESILKHFPDLNIYWLITGDGEMIKLSGTNIAYNQAETKNLVVNEPAALYNANNNHAECQKLLENYQLLINQKDVLINELKLLLEANRTTIKFSRIKEKT